MAKKGEEKKKRIIRSGEGPTLYTNFVEVGFTAYDFRVNLSEILEATEDEVTIKHIAKINMSPQQAKTVLAILAKKVAQYEDEVAKIDVKIEVKEVTRNTMS